MRIIISNISSFLVKQDFIKKIVEVVFLNEKHKDAEISIVFLNETEMAEINKKYRGKDKATDVLSFPQDGFSLEKTGINFIGEMLVCPSKIKNQADLAGVSYNEEMIRIIIHGTLHLLGYDHEISKKEKEKMAEKENSYYILMLK